MRIPTLLVSIALAAPAAAQPAIQTLVSAVGEPDANRLLPVELTLLNGGTEPQEVRAPARVPAAMAVGEASTAVSLERAAGTGETVSVPPGGFAKLRYTLRPPTTGAGGMTAVLSVREWGGNGIAFRLPDQAQVAALATPPVVKQSFESAEADTGNAFLRSLSAYEPIYGVLGSGTDSIARLQFSLKYQLFGKSGALRGAPKFLDGVYFAYSQRMFWDLRQTSSPLRDVDYMPELFYLVPGKVLFHGVSIGAQAGVRHESNGRDGADSRSLNTVYVQPVATVALGDYKLSAGPRLLAYVGRRGDNPEIARYRGHSGLFAEIGRDDGLRLSTTSRYNFSSGKGAVNAELSYPLSELIAKNLNLYLVGQVFAGYGENLLDYDRRVTRARLGIGIVR